MILSKSKFSGQETAPKHTKKQDLSGFQAVAMGTDNLHF